MSSYLDKMLRNNNFTSFNFEKKNDPNNSADQAQILDPQMKIAINSVKA